MNPIITIGGAVSVGKSQIAVQLLKYFSIDKLQVCETKSTSFYCCEYEFNTQKIAFNLFDFSGKQSCLQQKILSVSDIIILVVSGGVALSFDFAFNQLLKLEDRVPSSRVIIVRMNTNIPIMEPHYSFQQEVLDNLGIQTVAFDPEYQELCDLLTKILKQF